LLAVFFTARRDGFLLAGLLRADAFLAAGLWRDLAVPLRDADGDRRDVALGFGLDLRAGFAGFLAMVILEWNGAALIWGIDPEYWAGAGKPQIIS
jgi:hypothetical protein